MRRVGGSDRDVLRDWWKTRQRQFDFLSLDGQDRLDQSQVASHYSRVCHGESDSGVPRWPDVNALEVYRKCSRSYDFYESILRPPTVWVD